MNDSKSQPATELELAPHRLSQILDDFGFIECQEIAAFLNLVCNTKPDSKDVFWIKGKIRTCLNRYDNGSDYFEPLRIIERKLIKAYEDYHV